MARVTLHGCSNSLLLKSLFWKPCALSVSRRKAHKCSAPPALSRAGEHPHKVNMRHEPCSMQELRRGMLSRRNLWGSSKESGQ